MNRSDNFCSKIKHNNRKCKNYKSNSEYCHFHTRNNVNVYSLYNENKRLLLSTVLILTMILSIEYYFEFDTFAEISIFLP